MHLRVYQAFLQRGKMDWLIEKAQEIGIQEFCPLETERTMVKVDSQDYPHLLDRWQKIIREAAKQSGSLQTMKVVAPRSFKKAVKECPASEITAIFHPDSSGTDFRQWCEKNGMFSEKLSRKKFHLFFGPEGGFSDEEVSRAQSSGAETITLGSGILRTDTAFVAAAGFFTFD